MTQPIDPDIAATGFSVKRAYYLAKAAQAAYWDDLGDSVEELGLGEKAATFTFGQFHGFVAPTDEITLLAFRGTDSIENWLSDGQAAQVADPAYPGKVHQGFARAMAEIWPGLTRTRQTCDFSSALPRQHSRINSRWVGRLDGRLPPDDTAGGGATGGTGKFNLAAHQAGHRNLGVVQGPAGAIALAPGANRRPGQNQRALPRPSQVPQDSFGGLRPGEKEQCLA
jgi:hypothetical protein